MCPARIPDRQCKGDRRPNQRHHWQTIAKANDRADPIGPNKHQTDANVEDDTALEQADSDTKSRKQHGQRNNTVKWHFWRCAAFQNLADTMRLNEDAGHVTLIPVINDRQRRAVAIGDGQSCADKDDLVPEKLIRKDRDKLGRKTWEWLRFSVGTRTPRYLCRCERGFPAKKRHCLSHKASGMRARIRQLALLHLSTRIDAADKAIEGI